MTVWHVIWVSFFQALSLKISQITSTFFVAMRTMWLKQNEAWSSMCTVRILTLKQEKIHVIVQWYYFVYSDQSKSFGLIMCIHEFSEWRLEHQFPARGEVSPCFMSHLCALNAPYCFKRGILCICTEHSVPTGTETAARPVQIRTYQPPTTTA